MGTLTEVSPGPDVALGYKEGTGGKTWIHVEEMVAAVYNIVVIVQNIKRAL